MGILLNAKPVALSQIKDHLIRFLETLGEQKNLKKEKQIFRCEFRLEPYPILDWLSVQKLRPAFFWSDRQGTFEVGGIGSVDCIHLKDQGRQFEQLFAEIQSNLSKTDNFLRYYGGMAFDPDKIEEPWSDFDRGQFILPRFELFTRQTEGSFFACNIFVRGSLNLEETLKGVLKDFSNLIWPGKPIEFDLPAVQTRLDCPDKNTWHKMVDGILKDISAKQYDKVVLARETKLKLSVSVNPFLLLKDFLQITDQCFHFCFIINSETAFLGASPERLFLREGNAIYTEALAGTKSRGKTPLADQLITHELLTSAKELKEQGYVVSAVKAALSKLCQRFTTSHELSVIKLSEGMHLLSTFEGHLKDGLTDSDIMECLHPTPAVAGTPTKKALKVIKDTETFSRGWYAGPVGYIGFNRSEFAVAIRSILLNKDNLSLFAGAGIIDGSSPAREWDELEGKLAGFLKLLSK